MKTVHLSHLERAALEKKCNEVSKANAQTRGPRYFIGTTADEGGQGHALIETAHDGQRRTHWGDAADYHRILKGGTNKDK